MVDLWAPDGSVYMNSSKDLCAVCVCERGMFMSLNMHMHIGDACKLIIKLISTLAVGSHLYSGGRWHLYLLD